MLHHLINTQVTPLTLCYTDTHMPNHMDSLEEFEFDGMGGSFLQTCFCGMGSTVIT